MARNKEAKRKWSFRRGLVKFATVSSWVTLTTIIVMSFVSAVPMVYLWFYKLYGFGLSQVPLEAHVTGWFVPATFLLVFAFLLVVFLIKKLWGTLGGVQQKIISKLEGK